MMAMSAKYNGRPGRGGESGFTYIALLILIAVMGVALAADGEVWHMAVKREKEQQLLFVGHQFRDAIAMYYNHAPGQGGRYPSSLEDLLKDPRYPATMRYLRKIYTDPVTDSLDWGLVKGANGEILGVYSKSEDEPAKQGNFSVADQAFEGKTKYSEWVFMVSSRRTALPAVAAGGMPSGAGTAAANDPFGPGGQQQPSGVGQGNGSQMRQAGPLKAF